MLVKRWEKTDVLGLFELILCERVKCMEFVWERGCGT